MTDKPVTCAGYRLAEELGRGSTGIVFAAEQVRTGKRAAIKLLRPELSENRQAAARFFQEARLMASVPDQGVVAVFDHGFASDGRGYIAMERLAGASLAALIAEPAARSLARLHHIGSEIARILSLAHAKQIVHRDLKPDNVFLVPERALPFAMRVKVLDFGMAKLLPDAGTSSWTTESGTLIGTPLYMAPEQCRGGHVDARTDVYALGCILYELACGRPPFVRGGAGMILGAHLYETVPPPRELMPELPEALERLLLRALAKSPADRQQTMEAFSHELASVQTLHD